MAKYNVKFSCGHEEKMQLVGPIKDRYRRIEWWEECGLCSGCYKEQKRMDEAIAAEKNGLMVKEMHYAEYKRNYADCKTVSGSYNGQTKTIKVWVKKDEIAE